MGGFTDIPVIDLGSDQARLLGEFRAAYGTTGFGYGANAFPVRFSLTRT
ncbi:MAG: hypothetical protein ACI8R4_000580 [Paracoccaceae bacterium]|jgi:hypothetical protein